MGRNYISPVEKWRSETLVKVLVGREFTKDFLSRETFFLKLRRNEDIPIETKIESMCGLQNCPM
jgi:hypothetical protein